MKLQLLALACAALPALLYRANLKLFRKPARRGEALPSVSVLIPARNEEGSIEVALASLLTVQDVTLEVVVLDDQSTDRTAAIVSGFAARDARVRLETAPDLPAGWCGKQHACWILSQRARFDVLCFLDADVKLEAEGLALAVSFFQERGQTLVSGFPRQVTSTFLERLLLPLIHFILLGFLPISRMRSTTKPAYAAGCGQLMIADRKTYFEVGGHATIRESLHDGLKLPRAFRQAGFATDIFDATEIASCRMYRDYQEVWSGLSKNATEGLAHRSRIVPFTMILSLGQVLPVALLLLKPNWLTLAAAICAYYPRLSAARRFRQSWTSAILHPFGVLVLLSLQWHAFVRERIGGSSDWKGRTYGDPAKALPEPHSIAARPT